MNIFDDLISLLQTGPEIQKEDCELVERIFEAGFEKELQEYVIMNELVGVKVNHCIMHVIINAYRAGLEAYKSEKDCSELKELFNRQSKQ